MEKIFFWFYRKHKKEAINILEMINQPPDGIFPTRKLVLLPYLLKEKKIAGEKDYDEFIRHLKNSGYITRSDCGAVALTDAGKELLKKYQEFWLLRHITPMKIISVFIVPIIIAFIRIYYTYSP